MYNPINTKLTINFKVVDAKKPTKEPKAALNARLISLWL